MKIVLGIKLYSMREVGELIGVQSQTVSKYIRTGRLKATIIGATKYVSEENLKEFLLGKE